MNTDPAAIDLEPIRENWRYRGVAPAHNIMALIAAVETLRERVAELEAKKWEDQHTDTMNEMILLGADRDSWKLLANLANSRAEAAKARVDELVGILRRIESEEWDDMDPDDGLYDKSVRKLVSEILVVNDLKKLK